MNTEDFVKIVLTTECDDEVYVETPWAIPCQDEHVYELRNLPFYAYGISWGDFLRTEPCPDTGRPLVIEVIRKSGHRLVRIIFEPGIDECLENEQHLGQIVEMGCSYEGANPSYVAIDIPPEVDLEKVTAYLIEHDLQWEHADPRYRDLYPDEE